ncbi:MAG: TolC family protein [Candidatus Hydrogenedentes bacterium]|nr:TolC family protein [Candidatus Hydrogenedentota bacterium]
MRAVNLNRWSAAFALVAMLAGCAHTETSWTPETVAPPPLAKAAIEAPASLESRAESLALPAELSGPVTLTRDGAILTTLLNNRRIEVARFGPEIDATYIDENRAVFDPRLLAQISRGRGTRQSLGFSSTGTATSGGTTASKQLTPDNVADLLASVQRLNESIDALNGDNDSTVVGNSGSVEVQQFLPTGTLLFLTGAGTTLDHNPGGDSSQHTWTAGVSQPLLRGAGMETNLAALRQARNIAAQSEHEFRRAVLDVVRETERAYWELALAKEVLAIRAFGVTLANDQMKREEELESVGKALGGDVMTARAERLARQADLVDAQAALKSQSIELIRLMHPESAPRWEVGFEPQDEAEVVEVALNADESEDLALLYRPELAQARLTLANLELDVVRTRNGRLPQLNLVGEYEGASGGESATSSNTSSSDEDTYSVGLQFEMALFNRAERARHLRAQLSQERGAGYITQLEEEIAADVRQAMVEVERQWERLAATAEAVLSRREAVRVIEGRHEVGKATNLDVLQVQRDLIQSQVDDATARVRYIEALTELYAAEGTLLERRGIALDGISGRDKQQESLTDEVE